MWQPLLEALSSNYHVIAPDYIGFGHSSQPAAYSFNYTFDNLTAHIDQFIKILSLNLCWCYRIMAALLACALQKVSR
ncbi:alpha/beta fold hydrolase [Chitinophaga filiformis]|uniref:alpha/beta fold hydrolase n=1 Tax=Chitinophaga filiformis TaxID=104663 RepID=UPI003979D285